MTDDNARLNAEARAVMETAVDAIVTIDQNGTISSINGAAEEMLGWTRDEIVGQNVSTLMPEPYRSQHDDYLARYLAEGDARIIGRGRDLQARHKSGGLIPVHLAVSEFVLDGERHFTGILRDLSDLHDANEQIRDQAERLAHADRLSLMGEMTAAIAHEINQPLTAITMYAEAVMQLMELPGADPEKIKATLAKLAAQSVRAGDVIERIQRFARGQAGHKEAVSLKPLIDEVVALCANDVRLKAIEIGPVCSTDADFLGDAIEIQQVLANLIRNASDAMQEVDCKHGSQIEVVAFVTRDGERVRVEVRDTGAGVSEDLRSRLFTAFQTSKTHGMGMGLAVSKSIIDGHGGEIGFADNVGKPGTTFYFELPIVPVQGPTRNDV